VIDLLEKEEAIRDAELDYAHHEGLTTGLAQGRGVGCCGPGEERAQAAASDSTTAHLR
jgi:hypothetical protein